MNVFNSTSANIKLDTLLTRLGISEYKMVRVKEYTTEYTNMILPEGGFALYLSECNLEHLQLKHYYIDRTLNDQLLWIVEHSYIVMAWSDAKKEIYYWTYIVARDLNEVNPLH